MYLLAPFILQNFPKIIRADLELWRCAIFEPKMTDLSWTNFFWHKTLLLLSTYWPFSFSEILKKFLQQIQSYEDVPFLDPKMVHLRPPPTFKKKKKKIFFWKIISSISPFHCPKLKKFFQRIQSYEDVQFLGPKWPISQMRIFSNC